MKFPVICSAAALFCSTAFASPETLVVDSNHTFAHFSYSHLGFSTQQSRFNKTTGSIAGGVGGALLGHAILGGPGGLLVGAAAGGIAGHELAHNRRKHC